MKGFIIYNMTFKIDGDAAEDWLSQMKNRYIPVANSEVKQFDTQINEIMIDSPDGDMSFALQVSFPSIEVFESSGKQYLNNLVVNIEKDFSKKYVRFGTMMKVLHSDNSKGIE